MRSFSSSFVVKAACQSVHLCPLGVTLLSGLQLSSTATAEGVGVSRGANPQPACINFQDSPRGAPRGRLSTDRAKSSPFADLCRVWESRPVTRYARYVVASGKNGASQHDQERKRGAPRPRGRGPGKPAPRDKVANLLDVVSSMSCSSEVASGRRGEVYGRVSASSRRIGRCSSRTRCSRL